MFQTLKNRPKPSNPYNKPKWVSHNTLQPATPYKQTPEAAEIFIIKSNRQVNKKRQDYESNLHRNSFHFLYYPPANPYLIVACSCREPEIRQLVVKRLVSINSSFSDLLNTVLAVAFFSIFTFATFSLKQAEFRW